MRAFEEPRLGRADDDARCHIRVGSMSVAEGRHPDALIDPPHGAPENHGRGGRQLGAQ
jgi:hypothetical protein